MLTFNYEKNYKHINRQTGNQSNCTSASLTETRINREFLKRGETARDANPIDREADADAIETIETIR